MKFLIPILSLALAISTFAGEARVTLSASYENSTYASSDPLVLELGDSAKLEFIGSAAGNLRIAVSVGGKSYDLAPLRSDGTINPITVAGPATVSLRVGPGSSAGSGFATFSITRTGVVGEAVTIPQEVGSTWEVILEQSTDLVNWIPANPGDYSGSAPSRYFRTRLVRKTP